MRYQTRLGTRKAAGVPIAGDFILNAQYDFLAPNTDLLGKHFFGLNTKYVQLDNEDNDRHFGQGRNASGIIDSYKVYAYDGDDRIIFTAGKRNYADLGDGNDTVEGASGSDFFRGGDGSNRMNGHGGDDWLEGGDHYDYIEGGSGRDTLIGGDGHDYLVGGSGADTYIVNDDTQGGVDTVIFRELGEKIIVPGHHGHQLSLNNRVIEIFDQHGGLKAKALLGIAGRDIGFTMDGSNGVLEIVNVNTGMDNALV